MVPPIQKLNSINYFIQVSDMIYTTKSKKMNKYAGVTMTLILLMLVATSILTLLSMQTTNQKLIIDNDGGGDDFNAILV